MPYIKRSVSCGGCLFEYKHYSFRYGKKGIRGANKGKTVARQKEINNRIKRDRKTWVLLENFQKGDIWVELNYRQGTRPDDIDTAFKKIQVFLAKLSRTVKRHGGKLTYMQVTERGAGGGLHHHIIFRNNFDKALLTKYWNYGKVIIDEVYSDNLYQLASYYAKGRKEENEKRYSQSRNLVIPEVKVEVVSQSSWKKEPKAKKGYEFVEVYNGYHDIIGYEYQRTVQRMIC